MLVVVLIRVLILVFVLRSSEGPPLWGPRPLSTEVSTRVLILILVFVLVSQVL